MISQETKSMNEQNLFKLIKEKLFTAVIGDIMDKMGYTHRFLPQKIHPLHDDMFVAGRAMTVLEAGCFEELSDGANPTLWINIGGFG